MWTKSRTRMGTELSLKFPPLALPSGKVRAQLSVTGLREYVKKLRRTQPNLFIPTTVEYRMAQVQNSRRMNTQEA